MSLNNKELIRCLENLPRKINQDIETKKEGKLRERERGWLEGIIDGEGCFCITKIKNKKYWVIRLIVSNTDLKICEKIKSLIDGHIDTIYKKNKNHKTVYVFTSYRYSLKKILPQLKLIAKEKQRQIILEVIDIIEKQEKIGKIEILYEKLKKLNKRGNKYEKNKSY